MSRPETEKKVAPPVPAIGKKFEAAVIEAQNTSLSHADADAILAAGVDIGRLQALDFVATVANAAILPIYENVKKSKTWRFLVNPKSSNGSNFSSLEEFCEVKLGKTYGRMQHLVANRNLLGQEAFEQAEKMGLRQVDYNAIKALPQDDRELIRQAMEDAASRDQVLGLMQELAAKHAKEKESMAIELGDLRKEAVIKDQTIEAKETMNKEMMARYKNEREKVIAFETNRKPLTPIEHRDYESTEIQAIKNRIMVDMARLEVEVARLKYGDEMFTTNELLQAEAEQVVTLLMQRLQAINTDQYLYISLESIMGGLEGVDDGADNAGL